MKKQSLNGAWTLEIPGSAFGSVPARVPGSVYHDLLTAGMIPDPFYRDNELQALQLMENEFHYRRSFTADAELLKSDRVLLRCEGLDTLAEIYLNDRLVGRADNMHRIWEFDAKDALHEGENRIEVRFADPKLCARREGDEIVVSAEAYARSVEIHCGADVVLEDNYFDMNAGERRVRVLRGAPEEITLRSVYDIGRV